MDGYLDIKGLSKYASLSVRTLRGYLLQIPRYRVGGKILIKRSEFDQWMEKTFREEGIDPIKKKASEIMAKMRGK